VEDNKGHRGIKSIGACPIVVLDARQVSGQAVENHLAAEVEVSIGVDPPLPVTSTEAMISTLSKFTDFMLFTHFFSMSWLVVAYLIVRPVSNPRL